MKEVEIKTPFLYSTLQGGVKEDTDFNKIALGASSCLSTRVKSSAYLTRNSSAWWVQSTGYFKAESVGHM